MSPFYQAVYDLVRQIPPGKVASYGQLAFLAGRPRAARQAGQAMAHCPPDLPWHRVVSADGRVKGSFPEVHQGLLRAEGVPFLPDGRVDIARCRWEGPEREGKK